MPSSAGRVIAVEHLGGETYVYLERGEGEPLTVKAERRLPRRGSTSVVPIGVPASACYLFDDARRSALPRQPPPERGRPPVSYCCCCGGCVGRLLRRGRGLPGAPRPPPVASCLGGPGGRRRRRPAAPAELAGGGLASRPTMSSTSVRRTATASVRASAGASGSRSSAASRSAVCDAFSIAVASCGADLLRHLAHPRPWRPPAPARPAYAAPPSRRSGSRSRCAAASSSSGACPAGSADRRSRRRSRDCRRRRGQGTGRAAARGQGSDRHGSSSWGLSDSTTVAHDGRLAPAAAISITNGRRALQVPTSVVGRSEWRGPARLWRGRHLANLAAQPDVRARASATPGTAGVRSCNRSENRLHRARRHGRGHGGEPGRAPASRSPASISGRRRSTGWSSTAAARPRARARPPRMQSCWSSWWSTTPRSTRCCSAARALPRRWRRAPR